MTEIPIDDTIYTCILKHNDTISGWCYADIKFGKSVQQFSGKWWADFGKISLRQKLTKDSV